MEFLKNNKMLIVAALLALLAFEDGIPSFNYHYMNIANTPVAFAYFPLLIALAVASYMGSKKLAEISAYAVSCLAVATFAWKLVGFFTTRGLVSSIMSGLNKGSTYFYRELGSEIVILALIAYLIVIVRKELTQSKAKPELETAQNI